MPSNLIIKQMYLRYKNLRLMFIFNILYIFKKNWTGPNFNERYTHITNFAFDSGKHIHFLRKYVIGKLHIFHLWSPLAAS